MKPVIFDIYYRGVKIGSGRMYSAPNSQYEYIVSCVAGDRKDMAKGFRFTVRGTPGSYAVFDHNGVLMSIENSTAMVIQSICGKVVKELYGVDADMLRVMFVER